jgi:hypothetical protein
MATSIFDSALQTVLEDRPLPITNKARNCSHHAGPATKCASGASGTSAGIKKDLIDLVDCYQIRDSFNELLKQSSI